jgi:glyoxylase-like metal-dependent hydrolase (beta-lactamase superfamily II)
MRLERDVAPGVHRIADGAVNWFLVEASEGVTAVDAGVGVSWRSLLRALRELGRPQRDLAALVLTHAHFDHVGFAERARLELGLPVWCHEREADIASHPRRYPHERSPLRYLWRPGAMANVGSMALRGAFFVRPVAVTDTFAGGEELPVPGSPRVVPTPGHTPGHCALHLPERDALIAGDALVTLDPYSGRFGPRLVARAATGDSEQARASLDALADTGAATVLCGHGEPWTRGVEEAVRRAKAAPIA